ncbi:MAG: hypothetical protein BGO13_02070 [Burkholderiales bacterium 66-5]|nr:MAG: hypothetical protein BGO13_02070 [Burkholderiales bacterium 66-5]
MSETIDHASLSRLSEAGAITGAHIVGESGGWSVAVRYGTVERTLAAQRSRHARLFRRLETLVSYLKGLGIEHFEVNAEGYDPQARQAGVRRPDRAEALKRTHEAAAYDSWFRAQVQAAQDDPRPSLAHEDVAAEFAARRSALRQRMAQGRA